jgi:hypothetical protein
LLLSLVAAFLGCTRVENTFVVSDPGGKVATAELRLCGSKLQLIRSDGQLSGKSLITCEGEGKIVLTLSEGREISCHIGYFTPGAEQRFLFLLKNDQCRAKSK